MSRVFVLPVVRVTLNIYMSNSNKKEIAIVTGGSSGIGLAIVELFRKKSITTISVSRHHCSSENHIQCEVSDEESVKVMIKKVIKDFQKIDFLVNNAGISTIGDIKEVSLNEWNEVMGINLTGAFLCTKYVLSHMQERKQGKIINIASIAGRHRSSTASVAYTCSKYGMIGLTKQLAAHYAKHNININCVCPSQTLTPMLMDNLPDERIKELEDNVPAKRLAKPKEIAEAVYFLTSDASSYIHGTCLDVNGGLL